MRAYCVTFTQDIFSGSTHLSDSSSLILDRVDRHHAGIYQCAADNGVKDPVSMDIHLTILCKHIARYRIATRPFRWRITCAAAAASTRLVLYAAILPLYI